MFKIEISRAIPVSESNPKIGGTPTEEPENRNTINL